MSMKGEELPIRWIPCVSCVIMYGDDTELFFITGVDTILDIFGWKEPEELLSLCKFIVAARPGFDFTLSEKYLGSIIVGSYTYGDASTGYFIL